MSLPLEVSCQNQNLTNSLVAGKQIKLEKTTAILKKIMQVGLLLFHLCFTRLCHFWSIHLVKQNKINNP